MENSSGDGGGVGRVKVVGIPGRLCRNLRKERGFPGESMQKNGKFQGIMIKSTQARRKQLESGAAKTK